MDDEESPRGGSLGVDAPTIVVLMAQIRVLLIEDRKVVAEALASRFEAEADLTVVGTASSADAAISAIDLCSPDVTVVDIELADDAIELIRGIRETKPQNGVVVITARDDWRTAVKTVVAGAAAFVPKSVPPDDLIEVIRGVQAGESHVPPALLTHVLRALQDRSTQQNEAEERLAVLSDREREVLQLMVSGLRRREIAEHLVLSVNTVRTHIRNILKKLDLHSSLEAVSVALRAGMRPNSAGLSSEFHASGRR